MAKLFIKFRDNWADEMDVNGFAVMDKETWKTIKKEIKRVYSDNNNIQISIGSNEWLNFYSVDKYFKHFTVKDISDDQANVLINLFPEAKYIYRGYGVFPILDWEEEEYVNEGEV